MLSQTFHLPRPPLWSVQKLGNHWLIYIDRKRKGELHKICGRDLWGAHLCSSWEQVCARLSFITSAKRIGIVFSASHQPSRIGTFTFLSSFQHHQARRLGLAICPHHLPSMSPGQVYLEVMSRTNHLWKLFQGDCCDRPECRPQLLPIQPYSI